MDANDSRATVVLKPVGDVELWYAEPADCAWRLPVHVEWKQDGSTREQYGLVLPGVCFYQTQFLAMKALLGSHSLEDRDDRWLIPKDRLSFVLRKAPGIHAEFYYSWPDGSLPPVASHHAPSVQSKPRSSTGKSFAEYTSSEIGLPLDVVNTVLSAVSQVGPAWLVRHRRSIDFGFVKLIALPFRPNWKDIVMFKLTPEALRKAFMASIVESRIRLSALRLPAILCSPDNIGLCGTRHMTRLDYCIEAITKPAFDTAVEQIEKERADGGDYVAHYAKTVDVLYETITDCLANYARKIGAAWATVRKGRDGRSLALVPAKARRVHGVTLSDIPVDTVPTGHDFSILAERKGEGVNRLVQAKAAALQKVPAVLQAADDVRPRSGNGGMDES